MSDYTIRVANEANDAAATLAALTGEQKDRALAFVAENLQERKAHILEENAKDVAKAQKDGLSKAMVDRLTITEKRFEAMLTTIDDIIRLDDPVGEYAEMRRRHDGLLIGRMRAPLGVVFVIYESRPNVTIDAFALCFKSGNAVILRGGREAIKTNIALGTAIKKALHRAKITESACTMVENTDRALVPKFLKMNKHIDVVIPRGSEEFSNFIADNSRIPVVRHDKGLCHIYVDKDCDKNDAIKICVNAKVQRPGVCNAMETLLVHKDFQHTHELLTALITEGVAVRGCSKTRAIHNDVVEATKEDWDTEYLDLILSVRVVESYEQAVSHITRHGSKHTESILTNNFLLGERFKEEVDAAVVMVNASTRLSDGGEFGLGAEIGISNQKLHVRGPMALNDLTALKYVIVGRGHVRV